MMVLGEPKTRPRKAQLSANFSLQKGEGWLRAVEIPFQLHHSMSRILETKKFCTKTFLFWGTVGNKRSSQPKTCQVPYGLKGHPSVSTDQNLKAQLQVISHSQKVLPCIAAWLLFPYCSCCGRKVKTSLCFGEVFAFYRNFFPRMMSMFLNRSGELALSYLYLEPFIPCEKEKKKRAPSFNTLVQKVINPKAEMPRWLGAHAMFDEFGA